MSGESTSTDFAIYPDPEASDAYMARRRKLGYDVYNLMGIGRKDKAARMAAMLQNFDFFGVSEAPTSHLHVGLCPWGQSSPSPTLLIAPCFAWSSMYE
jgi:hypothetical protein